MVFGRVCGVYESIVIFVREYRFAWDSESVVVCERDSISVYVCESIVKKEVCWV